MNCERLPPNWRGERSRRHPRHDEGPHAPGTQVVAGSNRRAAARDRSSCSERSIRARPLVAYHEGCLGRCAGSAWAAQGLGGVAAASFKVRFPWRSPSNGSEEEKPLPARRYLLVWNLGNVRKVTTLKRGHGILNEQRARFLLPKLLPDDVVSGLKTQWPAPRVVCIAGHEVHDPSRDPAQRILLSARAKTSGQGAGSHLNKTAQPGPLGEALRLMTENGIALRVGDHGPKSLQLQSVQDVIHRRRDGNFVELHEQIIALIDAEARRVRVQSFEVLGIEMKIAARCQGQAIANFGL